MKKIIILLAFVAIFFVPAVAQESQVEAKGFRTASIFTDHMVIQRDTIAPVWGWADPGTKVTVTASWTKEKQTCVADDLGHWNVKISTPAAGGPYSLTISAKGEDKIVLEDVMSGEVWLCTGQSNMEIPIKGYPSQIIENENEIIADAPETAKKIRVYNITSDKAFEPQEECNAVWKLSSSDVTASTSAVAYLFAKRLTKALDVPVGIIVNAWGGSLLEPWLSREYFDKAVKGKIPQESYDYKVNLREDKTSAPRQIATMYNARMFPVKGYAMRGFLWYQGCSNLGDFTYYDKTQASMVECWRNMWGDTENKLPFYFVTIAPYDYENPAAPTRALFVENQLSSLDIIPNSGAAVTESIGDGGCIHPAKKQPVADQLFRLALERTYGVPSGVGSSFPYPETVEFPSTAQVEVGTIHQSGFDVRIAKGKDSGKLIAVTFANVGTGLGPYSNYSTPIKGFEVAGPDKVFHPVKASLKWNTVYIRCAEIPNPVAVRYAFHNNCESGIFTTSGTPVPSFRTDNLPVN